MSKGAIKTKKVCDSMIEAAERACDDWESMVDEDPDAAVYLYWRPPNKKQRIGRIKVAREDPKRGWKLTAHMMMSSRWSRNETMCFILERMLWVPILRGPLPH